MRLAWLRDRIFGRLCRECAASGTHPGMSSRREPSRVDVSAKGQSRPVRSAVRGAPDLAPPHSAAAAWHRAGARAG
jgi:hypothetical protein